MKAERAAILFSNSVWFRWELKFICSRVWYYHIFVIGKRMVWFLNNLFKVLVLASLTLSGNGTNMKWNKVLTYLFAYLLINYDYIHACVLLFHIVLSVLNKISQTVERWKVIYHTCFGYSEGESINKVTFAIASKISFQMKWILLQIHTCVKIIKRW